MPNQPPAGPTPDIYQYPDYSHYLINGAPYDQAARDDQVRKYIQQTLGEYGQLDPYAGTNADQAGQGRNVQLSAMSNFGGLLDNGWDPQAREMQRQALARSGEATAGQQGALLQQAQMGGGVAGPGSSAAQAAGAAAGQGGANAGAVAGRQAQSAALARRLQALGAYGSLAGAIRGGDVNANEQGYQNRLQQLGGMSATRNSLANYYTNQLNQGYAQNAQNAQTALGAGALGLGAYGAYQNMQGPGAPYNVGYSTDYGAGGLLPVASQYNQSPSLGGGVPYYWETP